MPSQQYEEPNRDASAAEQDDQSMATREQPAQGSSAAEQTPGTQGQPAYGSYGAAPAYGTGPGWSQPADQSAQGSNPDRSDSDRYDPNRSDQTTYDPNTDDPNRYDPDRNDPDRNDPDRNDPDRYDPDRSDSDRGSSAAGPADSDAVRAREKEAFGGVKIGAAFFGWLTAVGATVVLIAIVAAVASALDVSTDVDGTTTSQDPSTLGLGKIIAGLGILFVAYYIGGYVAGRMARFNGARQGLAVWLWAVLIAVALTLVGILFDSNNDLAQDVSLPDFRIDIDTVTTETLIAVGVVLAVTLVGAIVGGLAGMRFHRRVDRAGFAPDPY